jgi:hypothetical protein
MDPDFGPSISTPNMDPHFGPPIWTPNLGPQFGTPIWDPYLGPQYGTHHSYVLVVHTLRVAENEILKLDLPAKRH